MDRLKWAALGNRLKARSVEMGRKVGGKMKEMLQGPTQERKMVDEATSDCLEEPNWGLNLRICAWINSEEFSGAEVVRAIKGRISGENIISQRLSLDLLETCAMNCDKVFSEIASEKLLDDLVNMIDNPGTEPSNRQRALQLIQAWGESSEDLGYLPVFHQTYQNLRARGLIASEQDMDTLIHLAASEEYGQENHNIHLPEGYRDFNPQQQSGHQGDLIHFNSTLTVEEKKEILVVIKNSLEILSTVLDSGIENQPIKEHNDLTLSMLEKCKHSQPVLQEIIERSEGEELLFEALNLHDELQNVLLKYEETEKTKVTNPNSPKHSVSSGPSNEEKAITEEEEKGSRGNPV